MFPIPWNFPLRKKNGKLVNIGDAIDEGTEIPEHGEGDAGKVLSVDENGGLKWSDYVNSEIQTLTNKLSDEAATRSVMGAKNLLPNIASSGSYASSGTVTKNANGSLTINGTFDEVTTINIDYLNDLSNAVFDVTDLIGTDIAVSLLDTAVSGITLQVGYFNSAGTRSTLENVLTKANITFPAGAIKSATYLRIASGTYDNVTVYPMMRLASDKDDTYQPYAMTNRELTEYTSDVASDSYTKDGILVRVYRCGRQVMFLLGGTATADIAAATILCTLDSKFAPFETANSIAIKGANKTLTKLNIAANGQVYFDDAIANGEGPRLTSLSYIAKNP